MTLKMTTAQVVETLVTVKNNGSIPDYVHPDDYNQPTYEIIPGFKNFHSNKDIANMVSNRIQFN